MWGKYYIEILFHFLKLSLFNRKQFSVVTSQQEQQKDKEVCKELVWLWNTCHICDKQNCHFDVELNPKGDLEDRIWRNPNLERFSRKTYFNYELGLHGGVLIGTLSSQQKRRSLIPICMCGFFPGSKASFHAVGSCRECKADFVGPERERSGSG